MIKREAGNIIVICDYCDDVELDTETKNYHEALRVAREDGWRHKGARNGEPVLNKCPECRAKSNETLPPRNTQEFEAQ